jgi:hypothetical protein
MKQQAHILHGCASTQQQLLRIKQAARGLQRMHLHGGSSNNNVTSR